MKREVLLILTFIFLSGIAISQKTMAFLGIRVESYDCLTAFQLCKNERIFNVPTSIEECDVRPIYFTFHSRVNLANELYVHNISNSVILYGPFPTQSLNNCQLINSGQANFVQKFQADQDPGGYTYFDLAEGYYILMYIPLSCQNGFGIGTLNDSFNCTFELNCNSCITTFSPTPGKYVVSAWVKELNTPATQTSYSNSKIRVSFDNSSVNYDVLPSGKIIDGWQRMEAIVEVPTEATNIHLNLETTANGNAVFDDIRFFPNDGSMMSYVYDPISLKLVAELDERNYATKYEYDEEGQLIRVKKETEKGVMTIQENRNNTVKKP